MNVLLLGSGGREHAIACKISQSTLLDKLYIAPGNAGTMQLGENVDMDPTDFETIRSFVLQNKINFVIVGPEAPLVEGIYDFFLEDKELKEIPVFGPGKRGALLEGSKDFAKEFMFKHNIPTAAYKTFYKETLNQGHAYLEEIKAPYVLKADGLAGGKGVVICQDIQEAKDELTAMLADAKFGNASSKVVIEEFLSGIELSVFAVTDGKNYILLPSAKDYKRIGEGDTGLNTGGMGSISPVPFADDAFMKKVEERIVKPTIDGFVKDNIPYQGFVFIGLMNVNGDPFVIEYNVRLGDPETESIIPRIKSDFLELLVAATNGTLKNKTIEIDPRYAAAVMLVAGGYPESYEKGKTITGLNNINDSNVFHAGTKISDNNIITNGGRVIAVSSLNDSLEEALKTSYKNAKKIDYDKKFYRTDLGQDLMKHPC
ncbi:MAG: phosphoribosylamine--glycine ligase [Bacteroidota bacterium]|nr:phosphoribosylamine--glycine ligase [Bacteroidota bacterium]